MSFRHFSAVKNNYQYAPAGNITAKNTEHGNYAYQYDDLYRLTNADNATVQDEAYTYDAVGNRLTSANVTGAWSYNQNNELLNYDGVSNEYDNNGSTISKTDNCGTTTYQYDAENRLIGINGFSPNCQPLTATYYYDPFGRRLWKDISGNRTYFLYADEGLIGEYDTSGNEIKTYGYEPGSTWTTNPLFQKIGANYYWYQNDHLGTPQKIIDTNGKAVWSATYDSFGNIQIDVAEIENNLRFPGQYYDAETGLHYNYHRDYKPEIGRYVESDPIGIEHGENHLYGYVGNNPVNRIDPLGQKVIVPVPPGAGVVHGLYFGKGAKDPTLSTPGIDCIDEACRQHDICYRDNNIKIYPPFPGSSRRRECDRVLCNAILNCSGNTCLRAAIETVFYCSIIM